MPRNGQFGTKELCRVLQDLGFYSHEKWSVPKGTKLKAGQRSFIIVVKNKKAYMLPSCNGYIKEIKALGFNVDGLCN
jgi:hypothetical protein